MKNVLLRIVAALIVIVGIHKLNVLNFHEMNEIITSTTRKMIENSMSMEVQTYLLTHVGIPSQMNAIRETMSRQMAWMKHPILYSYIAIIAFITMTIYWKEDDANDSGYIPKSQRWKTGNQMKAYLLDRGRKVTKVIETKLNKWLETPPEAKRQKERRLAVNRIRTETMRIRTRPPKTALMLMSTILIMQSTANTLENKERDVIFDTDSRVIGVDNRASYTISDDPGDFEGELEDVHRIIQGFGGRRNFKIKKGTLVLKWEDDEGKPHKFRIPDSYYVPAGKVKLLSPQHWIQALKKSDPKCDAKCITDDKNVTLEWGKGKFRRTIPLGKRDNVATFNLVSGYDKYEEYYRRAMYNQTIMDDEPLTVNEINIVEDEDDSEIEATEKRDNPWTEGEQRQSPMEMDFDLDKRTMEPMSRKYCVPIVEDDEPEVRSSPATSDEELMLHYHHRFGHISFQRLREMAKAGVIPKRLRNCNIPACSACMYAKATKKPWRSKTRNDFEKKRTPDPGEVVSVDQMVSPTAGLVAQMTGKLTTKRYKYATVFVDQGSKLGYVYLQKTATAEETIEGKKAFEQYAADRGIRIRAYHADNGVFRANKWRDACQENKQNLTFSGVNAHHTNGMAEKRIRDLQDLARTMLIHAANHWKNCITANLWPYAVKMANDTLNNTPLPGDPGRRTAEQIFSKTAVNVNAKHYQTFGCPVYVLANELQSGNPYHKWKERAKVGIYLGRSPQHGRNVALVMDRETGLVSPQFHVQYDPKFEVVKQTTFTSNWQLRAGFVAQREKTVKFQDSNGAKPNPQNQTNHTGKNTPETSSSPMDKNTSKNTTSSQKKRKRTHTDANQKDKRSKTLNGNPEPSRTNGNAAARADISAIGSPSVETQKSPETEQVGSTPRITTNVEKAKEPGKTDPNQPHLVKAMLTEISESMDANDEDYIEGEIFCYTAISPDKINPANMDPLFVYKSSVDPDTLYHHEAMREPDRKEFKRAMQKEIDDRIKGKNFSIVHKSTVPKGATVLPAVWQLRRKRDIRTREIKKYKARLNIDGSRMKQGVHYDESYAPVASWSSIRMLLTLTVFHEWHTKQLDYVAAFPQAPVERELYMKIPAGVKVAGGENKDFVLKLHRNMYGQKNAGRVWNDYLVKKLTKEVGFKQSRMDECVFWHGRVMYVLYTDDSILAGPDPKEIEKIMEKMRKANLDITVEGDLEDFLGVNINRKEDGTIHLTQPHLIDSILKDLKLDQENTKAKETPACSSRILKRHSDSEDFDGAFNYRSVIGKLNYLERGSRSDIAYIVHQCARFTANPKKEHAEALRWLGRYLKGTRDKGTILKPVKGKELEVFVDADFAGNFDKDYSNDRDTARSRYGYIIMYQGCPVIWKSHLLTEITLSSTESEYCGLSYALRDTIPMMRLLDEMKKEGFPISCTKARVKCEVFEDNSGALEMARNHKYRPRTKHLCTKMHHFRDYVTRGDIIVSKIGTKEQLADYLTKPVSIDILQPLRKRVMGW